MMCAAHVGAVPSVVKLCTQGTAGVTTEVNAVPFKLFSETAAEALFEGVLIWLPRPDVMPIGCRS